MNAFQGRLRSLLFEKLLFPYESGISVIISRRRFMRSEGATVFCIKMCVCIWIIKQDEMRIKCFFAKVIAVVAFYTFLKINGHKWSIYFYLTKCTSRILKRKMNINSISNQRDKTMEKGVV